MVGAGQCHKKRALIVQLFKSESNVIKEKLLFWKVTNRIFYDSSGLCESKPVKMASQQQQAGGPMSQPGLQQQQLSQQQDFDPVHRFKMLIPQLKESLQVTVDNWP